MNLSQNIYYLPYHMQYFFFFLGFCSHMLAIFHVHNMKRFIIVINLIYQI